MDNNGNLSNLNDLPADSIMPNNSNNNVNNNTASNNPNTQMNNNDPNNVRNVFSNIGTPSFSFSQIPQHILQSLTQQQLKMIQQRHQQLLLSRIQQQQQQQQQNRNSPQTNNSNTRMNSSMSSGDNGANNSNAAAMMQMNIQQAQQKQPQTSFQQQPTQQKVQAKKNNNKIINNKNNNNNNLNTQPGMINIPPQIAQLPLATQIQVLNSLKHQAMSRNNPAAVTTITMAQQQVQQRLQQQMQQMQQMQQQQGQPSVSQGNPTVPVSSMGSSAMNMNIPQAATTATAQYLNKQQKRANPIVTPSSQMQMQMQMQGLSVQQQAQLETLQQQNTMKQQDNSISSNASNATKVTKPRSRSKAKSPKNQITAQFLNGMDMARAGDVQLPLPTIPRLELPKFQTIIHNPKETKLPSVNYWSSKSESPTTDTLLYEQIIQRDAAFKDARKKESQGYEPFSIYGFSNKEYISKQFHNLKYYQDLKNTRMQSITLTSKNIAAASIWGDGYAGYGNGITNQVTNVISEYIPEGMRKVVLFDDELVYREAMSDNEYNTKDQLVPIRLEFDQERDKFVLRDTLLWDKNDKLVNVNEFVKDMLMDYKFDDAYVKSLTQTVSRSIEEQIMEFQANPFIELNQDRIGGDDLRIKIKLDIVVGQNQLIDQFEWDISNSENNAEEFAENMCQELQLPGEFITAIAHSIREQVHMYHKSLALLGYTFDGIPVEDDDIRSRLASVVTLDDIFRPQSEAKSYTPNLLQISAAELERLDKDKDRDTRRKRRQGRFNRRGFGLITANSNTNLSGSGMGNTTTLAGGAVAGKSNNISGSINNNVSGNVSGSGTNPNGPSEVLLPDLSDLPRTFRTPIPTSLLPGGVDFGPPVHSYNLKTTVEYKPRPEGPKPPPPPCYIVDNIPGKSLLLSIKLKKREIGLPQTENNTEVRDSNKDGTNGNSIAGGITEKKDNIIPPEVNQPSAQDNAVNNPLVTNPIKAELND